ERKQFRRLAAKRAVGDDGLKRALHDKPPEFRVGEDGGISAHRLPEVLSPGDAHRMETIRDGVVRKRVQEPGIEKAKLVRIEASRRARQLGESAPKQELRS